METPQYFSSQSTISNQPSIHTRESDKIVKSNYHEFEAPIIISRNSPTIVSRDSSLNYHASDSDRNKLSASLETGRDSFYDNNNPKGGFFSAYSELGKGANYNEKHLSDPIYTVSGSNWRGPTMNSFSKNGDSNAGEEKTFIRQKKFLDLNKEI